MNVMIPRSTRLVCLMRMSSTAGFRGWSACIRRWYSQSGYLLFAFSGWIVDFAVIWGCGSPSHWSLREPQQCVQPDSCYYLYQSLTVPDTSVFSRCIPSETTNLEAASPISWHFAALDVSDCHLEAFWVTLLLFYPLSFPLQQFVLHCRDGLSSGAGRYSCMRMWVSTLSQGRIVYRAVLPAVASSNIVQYWNAYFILTILLNLCKWFVIRHNRRLHPLHTRSVY